MQAAGLGQYFNHNQLGILYFCGQQRSYFRCQFGLLSQSDYGDFAGRCLFWRALAQMADGGCGAVCCRCAVFGYGKVPVFALIIGGSFAVYGAVKKQVNVGSMVSTFMETAMVFPLFLLVMVVMESQGNGCIGQLSGWQYGLIPLAGVVTSVPLLVYAKGIQHTSLALSGILMYVNPTLQLCIGVFLYHEPFTQAQAVTFLFVWAAVIIFIIDSLRGRTGSSRQ